MNEQAPDTIENNPYPSGTKPENLPIDEKIAQSKEGDFIEIREKKEPEPPEEPISIPLTPTLVPAPKNSPESQAEKTLEEEYKELAEIRKELARITVKEDDSNKEAVALAEKRYDEKKEEISERIAEETAKTHGWSSLDEVPDDQIGQFKSEVNNIIFDNLVEKEGNELLNALEESKGETGGRFKEVREAVRTIITSLKAVDWYLKRDKWTKMAINTGLFTIAVGVGTFAGGIATSAAVGAVAYRGVRGVSSVLGSGLGVSVDKLQFKQIEQVDKEEKEKIQKLKNDPDLSPEKKTIALIELKEKFRKERKWITIRKAMMMIGGGVLAGSVTGGVFSLAYPGTGSLVGATHESGGVRTSGIAERIPRKGFEPPTEQKIATADIPEAAVEEISKEPTPQTLPESAGAFMHQVESGDSTWGILKDLLKANDTFKDLTEAQKTFVLSNLANKIISDPDVYGVGKGGSINVGDNVNFSKLLGNEEEVKSLFEKAKQTIVGERADAILENNQKITAWVKKFPDKELTNEEVARILSAPSEEIPIKKFELPEENRPPMSPEVDEVDSEMLKTTNERVPEKVLSELDKVVKEEALPNTALQQEIATEIGATEKMGATNAGKIETEMRTMARDIAKEQERIISDVTIDNAFKSEINNIYGKKGIFGLFGKVEGANTKEWVFMSKLSAPKVLAYFTGDSNKAGFSAEVVDKLSGTKVHRDMIDHTRWLMKSAEEKTGGSIKPFENENMEQFIKRMGGYIMRQSLNWQNLPKAA